MKYIVYILLMSLSLFSQNINYSSSYNQALKDSKQENKLLYVLITSSTCKWCRKFENTTLKDKAIQNRLNKEFITVHLSSDNDKIDKKFKTSPVPRHYFTDKNGKILYSALGYRDTVLFESFMNNAQEKYEKNKTKK